MTTNESNIVIAQTLQISRELIKAQLSGKEIPNRIEIVSNPWDVLTKITKESVDMVITGSQFYQGLDLTLYFTGGELAKQVRTTSPKTLVFRYSATPGYENAVEWGIMGDIPKEVRGPTLTDLLKDAELKKIVDQKDWEALRQKHPNIRFYDNFPE